MTLSIKNAVITITGARGNGKTTLASTYLPPSRVGEVYYHDMEHSANSIRSQLQSNGLDFGRYVDLADRFKDIDGDDLLKRINAGRLPWVDNASRNALVGLYEYMLEDLDKNLTPGRYKVYVLDTIEKFEAGMAGWVESNKKAAGVTITAYGRMWTDSVFPLYENLFSSLFGRGIEVIILTSHLKTPWSGTHQVAGKVEPSGKKLLYRLSSLMLWMVHNRENADGAPAALVLKERLGQVGVLNDDWAISRRLPERLPHATWTDIRRYLANGVDLANPAHGELMSDGERSMISELLTDEQMRLMVLEAEKEVAEASILPPSNGSFVPPTQAAPVVAEDSMDRLALRETALRLTGVGKSKSEIATELGLTLPDVIRLLKENN